MTASNYDDALQQLQAAGLIIPPGGLVLNTSRAQRVLVVDGGREKRGWYWLKEWSPSVDRLLIVGAFGVYRGNDSGHTKLALPKDDTGRLTPEQMKAMKAAWAEATKAAERRRREEAEAAALRAQKAFAAYAPAGESPYLQQKGITGDEGLRYTKADAAVVPITGTAGRIHGLQFLRTAAQAKDAERPAKEYWPKGLAKQGHFHMIGQPGWIILVAEGYATARTLNLATGYPVAVAFDANNLQPVAKALRKRYKQSKILLCADDDILGKCHHRIGDKECGERIVLPLHPVKCPACGEDHRVKNAGVDAASTAAMEVNGSWIAPKFANEADRIAQYLDRGTKDTDFNDLQRLEGAAVVRELVATHLLDQRWAPPVLRGDSSATTGDGGGKLRPIQFPGDLLSRFATVYGANGGVFDKREHALVAEQDVRRLCIRPDVHKAWMEHPDRDVVRQDEVGFDPAECDPKVTCNLWGGWPTVPRPGSCKLLLELLAYMCSGERNGRELYDWVLKWIAYPIQHPGAKMKSTIVVHGPQGTGKNLFFETVMAIYGKYGRILDQNALHDKHNDWASRKLFLIADEVVAQKDRFDLKNILKTLVTGTWIRINPKHIAAYDEANHVNLVFLSNESMPAVLEEDDRRHCVIWTPGKKDKAFYDGLQRELAEGGREALHDYLLNLDLGDFGPASLPPETMAKRDLIDLAQDSPVAFYDALCLGEVPEATKEEMPICGLTQTWYEIYRIWCTRMGVKPAPQNRFGDTLFKRRGLKAERKRFRIPEDEFDREVVYQNRVYLFNAQPPPGADERDWLGQQIAVLKGRLGAMRGER